MSAENTTQNVASELEVAAKGAVDATESKGTQSWAWRLVECAPSRTATEYQAQLGQFFDGRRFGQMFLDKRNAVLMMRRDVNCDVDCGA